MVEPGVHLCLTFQNSWSFCHPSLLPLDITPSSKGWRKIEAGRNILPLQTEEGYLRATCHSKGAAPLKQSSWLSAITSLILRKSLKCVFSHTHLSLCGFGLCFYVVLNRSFSFFSHISEIREHCVFLSNSITAAHKKYTSKFLI